MMKQPTTTLPDMLERDFYHHVNPEGEALFDRFIAAGGSCWAVSGENIA